jgi:signal transduction histidine kinase
MVDDGIGLHLRDGGGVMGRLIREKDWSQTALGPSERWPQSLRTASSICLASRFPMLIWWGRELSLIYNDAYIPMLGNKHPDSLGQPGRQAWGEIWDVIGPMLEGVMTRGEASWSEDMLLVPTRFGFPEETYFTWSYSPIVDESGGIGGAFTAVSETTLRVIGKRRLTMLRALGARLADVRDVDTASRVALDTIADNALDFPFAALYLVEAGGAVARRAAATANAVEHPAFPAQLDVRSAPWTIDRVMRTGEIAVITDLGSRIATPPVGAWPDPPHTAAVIPVAQASSKSYGVLVAGVSPRLTFDDAYRGLFELTEGHIGGALSAATSYEEECRRAEALAELDRAKSSFFSNISHEFRTPLTLMLGPTEDALRTGEPLSEDALRSVHRNEVRLLKLVNALLEFSRIEAGRVSVNSEPTDLPHFTRDVASAFRSAMERAGLRFDVDCAELPEMVNVDREMWEKIVLNLLSNALKFTFEGVVTVCLAPRDGAIELTVSDTGTGIPAEELPRLFERFHRVEGARSRTHEGSGIGLALTYELVKLHGGTIDVDSAVGRGTTFRVRVPVVRGRGDTPTASRSEHISSSATAFVEEALRWLPGGGTAPTAADAPHRTGDIVVPADVAGARVLVADDNADMREYLRGLLAARWTVAVAADGELALEAAKKCRPDIILADIMMPNLDGFGLLRAVREDPALASIPVVMVSARAGEEARVEGIEAGADDYLVKPFSARELIARVANMLQVAKLRRQVELERNRLMAFIEQTPVGVVVWEGPELRCRMANEAYKRMARRPVVVGASITEMFPELAGTEILERIARVLRDGVAVQTSQSSVALRLADGTAYEGYFSSSYQPLKDEHDATIGVIAVCTEVTEQVLARKAAEASRAEAVRANRAKDEFLAMLGHELRNPLAPILTAVELMRLRAGDVVVREREVIARQTAHLAALVEDLLDVSRIARGKVDLKREDLRMGEIIAKAIETVAPMFEELHHELTTHVPPDLVVNGDPERLTQVFANLLTNAAKYTDYGGRVTVSAKADGTDVVVDVCDTGRGITAEMLPRVFDLFVQEHQNLDRSRGGLGLGLAIVRNLVQLHGGRVAVSSPGLHQGSTFSVRLPRVTSTVGDVAAPSPGTAARAGRRPITVLVVDDNEDAAQLLGDVLESHGFETRLAFDAPQVLSLSSDEVPDVALLDIGLPAMDGYELARRLRELPRWRDVTMIAITGYGQDSDRTRSKEAGFDEHLVKPISFAALEHFLTPARPQRDAW